MSANESVWTIDFLYGRQPDFGGRQLIYVGAGNFSMSASNGFCMGDS